jgi:dimethylglycine dehydrogenase
MPIFGEVGIRRVINGAIPHTPDGAPLLGPAPGLRNFWMCCGTSFGIAQGGGCGKYLAQWMIHGDAEINMTEFDPRRFGPYADKTYVRDKVFLDYRRPSPRDCPARKSPTAGPQKMSPLYEQLKAQGCVLHRNLRLGAPEMVLSRRSRRGIRLPPQQCIRGGARARSWPCTSASASLDLTGFAKYDISGPGAESFLNRVCANRIPRKVGGIALVHMLSPGGRILGEMTVSRWPTIASMRSPPPPRSCAIEDLLMQSVLPANRVQIDNVTEGARRAGAERDRARARFSVVDRCTLATRVSLAQRPGDPRGRTSTCARCE